MPLELYRRTVLGDCLVQSLEEMMEAGTISEELAFQLMKQFDSSVEDAFKQQVTAKAVLKANLKNYRFFDDVWQFWLDNLTVKLSGATGNLLMPEVVCQHAMVVCVDHRLSMAAQEEALAAQQANEEQAALPAAEGDGDGEAE